MLAPGRRLRPQEIGLAASLGLTELPVYRRLARGAVLDRRRGARARRRAAARARSTTPTAIRLMALLAGLGCAVTDLGILPDRADAVRARDRAAAAGHDLVVTSGGMSIGEEDHVKAAVEALGKLHFWRLAIRPGRPVAMGQVGGVPFIGLPGNPVAVMVTFLLLARPLILRLSGAREIAPRLYRVAAGFAYAKKASRAEYLRASLERGERRRLGRAEIPARRRRHHLLAGRRRRARRARRGRHRGRAGQRRRFPAVQRGAELAPRSIHPAGQLHPELSAPRVLC